MIAISLPAHFILNIAKQKADVGINRHQP